MLQADTCPKQNVLKTLRLLFRLIPPLKNTQGVHKSTLVS